MAIRIIRNPSGSGNNSISSRKYKRTRRTIVSEADTLCRGILNEVYIKEKLKKSDYILVDVIEGTIISFAALSFMDRRTLRVIVLCSSVIGAGKRMQEAIEEFARTKGVRKLVLKALPEAAVFYEKMGYEPDFDTGMPNTNVESNFEGNSNNSFAEFGPIPVSKTLKKKK